MTRRVLIATVGRSKYQSVTYFADGRGYTTRFSPVATAAIEGCTEAIVPLTPEAEEETGPLLCEELTATGVQVRTCSIPNVQSDGEVWQTFLTIVGQIGDRPDAELVLDITHGFRHLPVVLFGSLAYLSAASRASIRRIRYGAFEPGQSRVPLLDLTPLLTLIDAQHAARQFVEAGDARPLGTVLEVLNKRRWQAGEGSRAFSRVSGAIGKVSSALSAGLPLEAGFFAHDAREALADMAGPQAAPAVAGRLIELLDGPLAEFAVARPGEKRALALSLDELERELRIIRFYFRSGAYDRVLLLLREWIVNRVLLATGQTDGWLRRPVRAAVERGLNGLAARARQLRRAEAPCVSLWSEVRERRNGLAHAGMCPEEVTAHNSSATIASLLEECGAHMQDDSSWRVTPETEIGTLLVTPLGLSSGVLYSGLLQVAPDRVLVLTSPEAEPGLAEACTAAGYDRSLVDVFRVRTPHWCFKERQDVVDWARPHLLKARRVVVNVTGGTTAMQYLVEFIGRSGEGLGVAVERIALIDPRPAEVQRQEPYVKGDMVALDAAPATEADA